MRQGERTRKVYAALGEFGAPLAGITPDDFAVDGTIFQIGVAPCRIDVINKIDGVGYADASPRAIRKVSMGSDLMDAQSSVFPPGSGGVWDALLAERY